MNAHRQTRIARSRAALVLAIVVALALTAGTALGSRQSAKANTLTALIGSSGPAETFAVNNAAKAFTKRTGIPVNVIAASDLGQQLAQGFASGNPPDIFYLGNDQVATYAKAGDLAPLDNLKNVKSFYPSLRAAYTYKGHLYAAPKDFSTLALVINTNSWKGAHLTSANYPKTWAQLAAVSKKQPSPSAATMANAVASASKARCVPTTARPNLPPPPCSPSQPASWPGSSTPPRTSKPSSTSGSMGDNVSNSRSRSTLNSRSSKRR